MSDEQYHNGIRLGNCSVKIQKLPKKFDILAESMKKHFFHEGKNPHRCNVCDKSFSYKQYLKQHIESVHKVKEPHKCKGPFLYRVNHRSCPKGRSPFLTIE